MHPATTYDQKYPLHGFIRRKIRSAEIPLKYVPLVNSRDSQGIPPLFYARTSNEALWLIRHGAHVNADGIKYNYSKDLFDPMPWCAGVASNFESAVMRDCLEVADVLVRHGANMRKCFERTLTPPICCVTMRLQNDLLRTMIHCGAKVQGYRSSGLANVDTMRYSARYYALYFIPGCVTDPIPEKVKTAFNMILSLTKVEPTYTFFADAIRFFSYEDLISLCAHLRSSWCLPYPKKSYSHPYSIPWIALSYTDNPIEALKLLLITGIFKRVRPGLKKIRELQRYQGMSGKTLDRMISIVKDEMFPSLFDLLSYDLLFREKVDMLDCIRKSLSPLSHLSPMSSSA